MLGVAAAAAAAALACSQRNWVASIKWQQLTLDVRLGQQLGSVTQLSPQACVKKDERALRGFVQRYIQLPLPDHGGRLVLLGAFAQVVGLCGAGGTACFLVVCGSASLSCMPSTIMMCIGAGAI